MTHSFDWIDMQIEQNPILAYKTFRTVGPKEPAKRGKRAIVIGCVAENKVISETFDLFEAGRAEDGDYHHCMNASIFEKWLERVLPILNKNANGKHVVLVLDNAPYHRRLTNLTPRKNSKRSEMFVFIF